MKGRRDRDERGAALVEFGIVVVLLFTLLFGIAEFGVSYDRYLGVRTASREGARQGAVGTFGSTTNCGINGTAASANTQTRSLICLTKSRSGLGNDVRVAITVPSYAPGAALVVCVQYRLRSITGLFGPMLNNKVVQSDVQIRIEEPVSPGLQSTSELSPNGGAIPCAVS
jgi:Flp pilus assembly protein TadG